MLNQITSNRLVEFLILKGKMVMCGMLSVDLCLAQYAYLFCCAFWCFANAYVLRAEWAILLRL